MSKFILIMLLLVATNAYGEIKSYGEESLNEIKASYENQSFLLILWSHDCAPCREELKSLASINQRMNVANIVLLNTDGVDQIKTIENILTSHQLMQLDNWVFANTNLEKLRYSIDVSWAGELPRSYFYSSSHQRNSKSGRLSMLEMEKWLQNNQPSHFSLLP